MTQDFGVYGYVKPTASVTAGGYIMKNANYDSNGDVVGATKYYWPKADNNSSINVNFVAYSPYKSTGVTFNSDIVTIPVTASATVNANCTDVLYAYTVNEHPQDATQVHRRVPLLFHHALAWVEFKGCYDATSVKSAKITSITLSNNLYTTGEMKLNVTSPAEPTWENKGDATAFNFAEETPADLTTAYRVLSDALVIPQAVPTTVTITFDITLQGADGDILYSGRTVTKTINAGTDMATPTPHSYLSTFTDSHKYIYQIKITAEEVDFSVSVDDWSVGNTHPFQTWDHDALAYVESFFDKALIMQGQKMVAWAV